MMSFLCRRFRVPGRPLFGPVVIGLLVLVLGPPGVSNAQVTEGEDPLRKSDLVRMLASGEHTSTELAQIIRTRCLTFSPAPGDLKDFRALGADEPVLDAIRTCGETPEEEPAGRALTTSSPLYLLVQDTLVRATVGDTFALGVRLLRQSDDAPAAGVRIRLEQRAEGAERTATAVSVTEARAGGDGRVTFRASAPVSPGGYLLRFDTPQRPLAGTPDARLRVLPGAPTFASVEPPLVEIGAEDADMVRVTARISDSYGNPVPGADVRLLLPPEGRVAGAGVTDERGRAVVSIQRDEVSGASFLILQAGERRVASLPVVSAEETVAEDRAVQPETVESEPRSAADSMAFLLAEAERAEEESATGRAQRLYRAALELDSRDAEALAGMARVHLRKGEYEEAIWHFQRVVAVDSTRFDARMGVGDAALEAERLELAVHWYRTATEQAPDSVAAWVGLARAYRAAGNEDEEAQALRMALELTPDREELQERLAALRPSSAAVRARLTLWGGNGFSNADFDSGSGLQRVSAEVWPEPGVFGLYAEYDREGIQPERSGLIRGGASFEAWHGGIRAHWGPESNFSTRVEAGLREQPPAEVQQRLFRIEQAYRFGDGTSPDFERLAVRVVGTLGDWEGDRGDDYLVRAGADFPVTSGFRVSSDIQYGKARGTWSSTEMAVRVAQQEEFRFWVTPTYRSPEGWEAEVRLAYGRVENSGLSSWDTLLEGSVQAAVPLDEIGGPSLRDVGELVFFYRYQAPGINRHFAFQVLSVGVSLALPE